MYIITVLNIQTYILWQSIDSTYYNWNIKGVWTEKAKYFLKHVNRDRKLAINKDIYLSALVKRISLRFIVHNRHTYRVSLKWRFTKIKNIPYKLNDYKEGKIM